MRRRLQELIDDESLRRLIGITIRPGEILRLPLWPPCWCRNTAGIWMRKTSASPVAARGFSALQHAGRAPSVQDPAAPCTGIYRVCRSWPCDDFRSYQPVIEERGDDLFKYRSIHPVREDDVAAICVSCPTNPTGNVLTDEEVQGLVTSYRT